MTPGDLTQLPAVKAWLKIAPSSTVDDALLKTLITVASQKVLAHLGRPIAVATYTDNYQMPKMQVLPPWLLLRQWPVTAVSQVLYQNNVINASALAFGMPPQNGWLLEDAPLGGPGRPQKLSLYGFSPWPGDLVQVIYTAGYRISDPFLPIPSGKALSPLQTWIGDVGVSYANGQPLTPVTTTPGPGQYFVTAPTDTLTAIYNFNTADIAAPVQLIYSSPPAPVEHVVVEKVGREYKERDRIGIASQSLTGQGNVVYIQDDKKHHAILSPYARVAPV